jgi:hypothetical protein
VTGADFTSAGIPSIEIIGSPDPLTEEAFMPQAVRIAEKTIIKDNIAIADRLIFRKVIDFSRIQYRLDKWTTYRHPLPRLYG